MDVMKMAIPGIFCILVMFFLHFFINLYHKIPNDKNAVISFTDTGKNFELVIAVSAAVVGIQSSQAFVGVIGPMIKMPVLILFVRKVSKLKDVYFKA